jgi:hypothetical protein
MSWANRKWRDAHSLDQAGNLACAISCIVLLVVFTALGKDTLAVVLGVVAVLAAGLALVCCLRNNSLP